MLTPWLEPRRTLLPTSVVAATLPGLSATLRAAALDPYGTQLNDVVLQLAPWEREVRRAFAGWRLPFWSDTLDGGCNLWGNPQAGVLSPVALAARLFPWRHFLLVGLALKITIAFSGTVVLARRLGARADAARLAGLGFALGGAIFAWALFPLSTTAAWVPWWSAALLRLLRRPSAAALTATAVAGAALLLSGHPEVAFAGGLFGLGLAVLLRRRSPGRRRRAAAALLGCALAAGLAAPGCLPFLSLVPGSQRFSERRAPHAGIPSASPALAIGYTAALRPFLAAALDGDAFGRPYSGVSTLWPVSMMPWCGRAAVLLAVGGALFGPRRRRPLRTLLACWLGLVLVAPSLEAPGLLALPAMNRFLPVGDLALALAAALGCDALARTLRRSLTVPKLALLGALLAALDCWLAPTAGAGARAALWLPVSALACGAVGLRGAARGLRRAAAWSLLLWTGFELGRWDRTLLPRGDARLFFPETALLGAVGALVAADAAPPRRAVGLDQLVPPSILPAYGIGDIRPHNPLAPAAALRALRVAFGFAPDPQRYFGAMHSVDHPLLAFLDVGAVVSNSYLPAPRRLERLTMPNPSHPAEASDVLWRVPDPVGRFFLATGFDRVAPAELDAALARMQDPRHVILDAAEARALALVSGIAGGPAAGKARVRLLRGEPGDVTLVVDRAPTDGPLLLASSLPGPLGWRAVDRSGSPLRTLTVNGAYLGVWLPAGADGVRLRFRPPGLLTGTVLCAASLLALAAAWAFRARTTLLREGSTRARTSASHPRRSGCRACP